MPKSVRAALLILSTALTLCAAPTFAQIQMEELQPAAVYDAGILDAKTGGLGPQLWQGTTAARAVELLEHIDVPATGPAHDLVTTVLLSGGIPPQADGDINREHYIAARLGALLSLNEFTAFQTITDRANLDITSPAYVKLFTEHALLNGQTDRACGFADTVQIERKTPYWAKLRAFCHFTRDELPAAELTADLLGRSDHEDKTFFTLLGNLTGSVLKPPKTNALQTPLHIAMARLGNKNAVTGMPAVLSASIARDTEQPEKTRLSALKQSATVLTSDEISQIFNAFSEGGIDDVTTLPAKWNAKQWGQVYRSLNQSTDTTHIAALCSAMLKQAEIAGISAPITSLLGPQIALIPYSAQAAEAPALFARIAVQNRDLGALSELHMALNESDPLRGRIALASDALGNGFMLSELGVDIETRLGLSGEDKITAIRDTYLAIGLGARLSSSAIKGLDSDNGLKGYAAPPSALLALQDAARRRAQAETVLRAAQILGTRLPSDLRADSLSAILTALNDAGLTALAGQLAAQDFLSGF